MGQLENDSILESMNRLTRLDLTSTTIVYFYNLILKKRLKYTYQISSYIDILFENKEININNNNNKDGRGLLKRKRRNKSVKFYGVTICDH